MIIIQIKPKITITEYFHLDFIRIITLPHSYFVKIVTP